MLIGQPVKCLTVRNLPVEKKLLLVENEFITPITDLKPDIFGSKPLLQDSKGNLSIGFPQTYN